MTDKEKVINILSKYINCSFDDKGEKVTVDEIIELLKAQEPRVLALDEIHRGMAVWLEDRDKPEVVLAIGGSSAGGRKCFITEYDVSVAARDDEYGIRWRAWNAEPTEAQRSETPWN